MSDSTKTSEDSRQLALFPTLESCPTSSSAARRARTSPAPTPRAKGSRASGRASTSKPSAWSEIAALAGSLLKTALISELAVLTGCSLSWKRSATPANRAWWVLTALGPTIFANGHGSSATTLNSLPTPVSQSQQGGIRLEGGSGARHVMKESGLYDLFRNRPLPTPMASDGMKDGTGGGAGSTYPLRMILATPRKSDADRGGRGDVLSQLQGYNSRHARMMGTPTANAAPRESVLRKLKGRMTSDQDGFDRVPTMSEVLHFDRLEPPDGLMPTPVKPNGGRRLSAREIETGKRANGAKAQIDTPNLLRHVAETLPTPTKRDSRMDGWSPAYDRRKSPTMDAVMDGAMTDRAPDKWAGARALAAMLRSHGLTGTAALPVTYCWMMGFPPGWLARALLSAVAKGRLLAV